MLAGDRCLETASTSMPTSDIIDATVVSTRVASNDSSLPITTFTVIGIYIMYVSSYRPCISWSSLLASYNIVHVHQFSEQDPIIS